MANHLLALLSIALLTGCVRYSEVEIVGVQDVQVTRFDATGLSATVTVEVNNPNNYRISVTDPDVDLYINDVAMGKATLDSMVTLDPASTRTYVLPLHATFTNGQAGMLPLLMTVALTGSVKLGLKGTAVGKAGMLRKRFPVEVEQRVDFR
ncbi:MAG: LEA type 2 family protein [Flavobacteriales bacterium]|jgi:LEA14-like dessication related protein|nr:LEA type 2 family protein [Flavobacteriales bacterium]MBK9600051.1 LEA type 2 family protein [Flavobacteriales bacterium]